MIKEIENNEKKKVLLDTNFKLDMNGEPIPLK